MRLFVLALISAAALAQPSPLLQNIHARKTTSLNGAWRSILDPYEVGYLDYRYQPLADGGFGANRKPKSPSELVEYDFDRSPLIQVPGDWNTQRPELLLYEGTIWYKRDFDYNLPAGRRLFLHIGAANYSAVAFVNSKKLGDHTGGYTPFNFEITPLVQPKGNFVIVKVDDQRKREGVPTVNTDWWNYGGLHRDVTLVEVPETFIEDYFLQLEKGSSRKLAGWIRLNGSKPAQRVTVRIPEANASLTVTTDAKGYAPIAFDASLTLWSPANPKLYRVEFEAETDKLADDIGFRNIETRGHQILLNGQPIILRGIDIHAEAPYRTGRAFSADDNRTLLGWAQELNCNFVRLAHYPHDESMPRLADKLGILLWEEIPVYWTIQWENAATYANADSQLHEMIARDHNRASVILWSVANETPVIEPRLAFLRNLAASAHSLDPTRLVTAALERHYIDEVTQMINDPLGEFLDVLGCNEYIGWYDGPPEKADTAQWKTTWDKPLILSELGGGALQGNHGPRDTLFTEEYQSRIYEHQIAMFKRIPFLSGTSPWILMDFRSPRRPLAGIQDYFNRKGLISERGQKKQAFYVLRDYYKSLSK